MDHFDDGDSEKEHQYNNEKLFKVIVVGDFGVGKTSIIRRFTTDSFKPNYKLTVGVDFAVKDIRWKDGTLVRLQLWDIAGNERFGGMTHVYYKHSVGAIIVCDMSRMKSLETALKWLKDVKSSVVLPDQGHIPIILLANKCDLSKQEVTEGHLIVFCRLHNIDGWFSTSAKENINIDRAFNFLIEEVLHVFHTHGGVSPWDSRTGTSLVVTEDDNKTNKKICC